MPQPATEQTTGLQRGEDADQSCLRIDSEVFELLSDGPLLDVGGCSDGMVRWFDTWSWAGR